MRGPGSDMTETERSMTMEKIPFMFSPETAQVVIEALASKLSTAEYNNEYLRKAVKASEETKKESAVDE